MTKTYPSRAVRRHVRLRCVLHMGTHQFIGFSNNISTTGLYVCTPKKKLNNFQDEALEIGYKCNVSLKLPNNAASFNLSSEVMWVNLNDHDMGGQPVIGLGLRFISPNVSLVKQLSEFIQNFRYAILVVDDEAENLDMLDRILREDYRVIKSLSVHEALSILEQEEISVLITDQRMPGITGLEFLKKINDQLPHVRVIRIVLSAYPDIDQIQAFINLGKIFHYIHKPFQISELLQIVRRAIDSYAMSVENERLNAELERIIRRLKRENTYLRQRAVHLKGFENIKGKSQTLRHALEEVERIRKSEVTVHIFGETGTGKELVARALHFGGPRAKKPFVAQNCAGITETFLQSTLFGHKKGSRLLGQIEIT